MPDTIDLGTIEGSVIGSQDPQSYGGPVDYGNNGNYGSGGGVGANGFTDPFGNNVSAGAAGPLAASNMQFTGSDAVALAGFAGIVTMAVLSNGGAGAGYAIATAGAVAGTTMAFDQAIGSPVATAIGHLAHDFSTTFGAGLQNAATLGMFESIAASAGVSLSGDMNAGIVNVSGGSGVYSSFNILSGGTVSVAVDMTLQQQNNTFAGNA